MWLIVVELPKAMWFIVIELPKAMWWSIVSCSPLGANKQKRTLLLKGSWQVHHYMSSDKIFLSNKKPRDQPDLRPSYIFSAGYFTLAFTYVETNISYPLLLKVHDKVHHYRSSDTIFLSNKKPRDQPDLRSSYIFQPDTLPWHSQMSKHTNATTVVKGFMTILLDHRSYPKPLRTAHTPNHSDHSSDPWLSRP